MRDVYLTNDSKEWAHSTDQRKHKNSETQNSLKSLDLEHRKMETNTLRLKM